MLKIQKCQCACCGKEEMFFLFSTDQKGAVDTSITFTVENSYHNENYVPGMQLNENDLKSLLSECDAISLMCLECTDDCDSMEITFEGHEPKMVENASAKEIIRYMLADEIKADDAIWSMADMYDFMMTPTMGVNNASS